LAEKSKYLKRKCEFKGSSTNNFPILLPYSPHLPLFFGRKIFNVAIATSQILLGQKNEIWGKPDNQYEEVIYGRALSFGYLKIIILILFRVSIFGFRVCSFGGFHWWFFLLQ
jgi:hypothetical protein